MSTETRLQLKQPTGWFAAGREVALALTLLSDATFKVFFWLCLHAERRCGALTATPADIARALGKTQNHIRACLDELQRQEVCIVQAGSIQISDRFWPYRRSSGASPQEQEQRYVEEVKRLFLERHCVQSSFSAADQNLARSLYQRGVSLTQVERAILLGAVRKYLSCAQNHPGTPISSLHYFTNVLDEVMQEDTSIVYWKYVADKLRTLEREWRGFASAGQNATLAEYPGNSLKSETK
jgi:hypothetical protein